MASQKQFSNTDSIPGDKPADPYKATNLTDPELPEKVQDLVKFIESCKFGMMTTRIESSGLLTSRCMALAAKVYLYQKILAHMRLLNRCFTTGGWRSGSHVSYEY